MNRIFTICSVYLIVNLLEESHSIECPKPYLGECRCLDYNGANLLCPSSGNPLVVLKISKKGDANLQCYDKSFKYIEILPNINVSDSRSFTINSCYLEEEINDILKKLHITNLRSLYFEYINLSPDSKAVNVTKELFSYLQDLGEMSFSSSNISFDNDFLRNTPNLLHLTLSNVGLVKISFNLNYLPRLKRLRLSMNQISSLSSGTFKYLRNLTQLYLDDNKISSLTADMFEGLESLEQLDLSGNQINELAKSTFEELKNLQDISLQDNNINTLYENIFKKNDLLTLLWLEGNKLEELPENIFRHCGKLKELTLSMNEIITLPQNVFKDLKYLRKLDISSNRLTSLPQSLFASLTNLESLNLSYNKLRTISLSLFHNLDKLKILDIQENVIANIEGDLFPVSNSSNNDNLVKNETIRSNNSLIVDLSHNEISRYPKISTSRLRKLDLSFNQIDYVEIQDLITWPASNITLKNNKIKRVDFSSFKLPTERGPQYFVNLEENPIECNCFNYDLFLYNNNQLKEINLFIQITQERLMCAEDHRQLVKSLKPDDIQCPVSKDCPPPCECSHMPYSGDLIVNCSSKSLTVFSLKPDMLYSEQNGFKRDIGGYVNVTHLDLSNNLLTEINWIPTFIKELNLNDNQIKNINSSFIAILNNTRSLKKLYLKGNPWECTCESLELQKYLIASFEKVNSSDVYCQNDHMELASNQNICKISEAFSIIIPAVLGLFLCLAILFALYYRYQRDIKMYLFAKKLCLCLISEEELDKDKIYDVFISYSHKDEKFVLDKLLPELENGSNPLGVCLHIRDWVPGKLITEQVFDSVKNSRRTLIILSNNFIESIWGKLEFRTAHTEAVTAGRAKVIVVMYGDLNESRLDEELKSYLKSNTYIKWGDKYFWQKLKYALPHSRI